MDKKTIILNFSHPITDEQRAQIAAALEREIEVLDVPFQLDLLHQISPQVRLIVSSLDISPEQWQSAPIIVNLPGFSPGAAALLAELHGRMGYFPPIIRLRRQAGWWVFAEVVDLQEIRDLARQAR